MVTSPDASKQPVPRGFCCAAVIIAKELGKAREKPREAGPSCVTCDHLAIFLGRKRYRQTLD